MVLQNNCTGVEFRFFRSQAAQVYLVGDFNDWNTTATPMQRERNGEWVCRLDLPGGAYHFKYLSDGEWFLDYAAFGMDKGPFGWNSVVLVERAIHHIEEHPVATTKLQYSAA